MSVGIALRRRGLVLVLGLVALVATPAPAELEAWDQARVTSIAKQLAAAANDVYNQFYAMHERSGDPVGEAYESGQLEDTLRAIREQTRHLEKQLEKGKAYDATVGDYKRLREMLDNAHEYIQRVYEEKGLIDAVAKAKVLLHQLDPYYDPKALADPQTGKDASK
jgi:hypothetical protein